MITEDMLRTIWNAHVKLQQTIPPKGRTPYDIKDIPDKVQFAKDMELATRAELQEMLDEMSWKPWAKGDFFYEDAVQGEIIDAFHFLLNLAMLAGMTADSFFTSYMNKNQINMARHADGEYTHTTDKCPGCKRGMDDPAVNCYYLDNTDLALGDPPVWVFCKVLGKKVSISRL